MKRIKTPCWRRTGPSGSDKQTGKSYLTLLVDNKTTHEVEVKTGLRNDNFSEILSGASEGQVVVVPQTTLLGQ